MPVWLVLSSSWPKMMATCARRLLHAQRELAELPVVLTTGLDLELPSFEGAVCLLRKPFAREELLRLLSALTRRAPPVVAPVRPCCQVA